jgi:hypothetical protein
MVGGERVVCKELSPGSLKRAPARSARDVQETHVREGGETAPATASERGRARAAARVHSQVRRGQKAGSGEVGFEPFETDDRAHRGV